MRQELVDLKASPRPAPLWIGRRMGIGKRDGVQPSFGWEGLAAPNPRARVAGRLLDTPHDRSWQYAHTMQRGPV